MSQAIAAGASCRHRKPSPWRMQRKAGQGPRWSAEPWFAFLSLGSPRWLESATVRSCEVREINTLATGAKPRFIPAGAARQGIAENGGNKDAAIRRRGAPRMPQVRRQESCGGEVGKGAIPRGVCARAEGESSVARLLRLALWLCKIKTRCRPRTRPHLPGWVRTNYCKNSLPAGWRKFT